VVASLEGTISEEDVFRARPRICDLGLMREAYRETDGQIAYRCPAEPVSAYVTKGGAKEKTERRKCLCNALLAAIGQTQTRVSGFLEPGVITAGDDLAGIVQFIISGANTYSAADVLSRLLSGIDQKMRGRMESGWNCVQDCLA
jgi:nitronate monooxygenase